MASLKHFTRIKRGMDAQESSDSDSDAQFDTIELGTELHQIKPSSSRSSSRSTAPSILSATAASAATDHADPEHHHDDRIHMGGISLSANLSSEDTTTDDEETLSASGKKAGSRKSPSAARRKSSSNGDGGQNAHADANAKYLTAHRIRMVIQGLSIGLLLLYIVRASIACWTAQSLTARTFAWLPFSFEVIFNIVCGAIGAGIFGNRAVISKAATSFVVIWLVFISFAINVALFRLLGPFIGDAFFEDEPGTPLNNNWYWIYNLLLTYFVLTVIGFFLNFVLCVLMVTHTVLWSRGEWAEEQQFTPRRSSSPREAFDFLAELIKNNYVMWFMRILVALVLMVFVALFITSIAGIIQTFTVSGYCTPSSPSCYRGCDPIDPSECIYPFPSTFFMKRDDGMLTGWRLDFDRRALPQLRSGGSTSSEKAKLLPLGIRIDSDLQFTASDFDVTYYNELDGWSTVGPLLFNLASKNISADDLIAPNAIDKSLSQTSPVIIINTVTNAIVPLWAEKDATDYANSPSIIIQPAVPLDFSTRYVVGVRRIRDNSTGEFIAPTPAMKALLATTQPSATDASAAEITVERWSYYQQNIFPALNARGFVRADVQLAWDFVTASQERTQGRAELMRDDMLARHARGEISYRINKVVENDCTTSAANNTIGRTVYGEIDAPLYLTSQARLATLPRGADGKRLEKFNATGTHTSKFIIRIPCTLINNPRPAKALIQYGHGLFGSRTEVRAGWLSEPANRFEWILFASDWFGMALYDVLGMARVLLGDPSAFVGLPESSLQGFVDKAATLRVIVDKVIDDPSLQVGGVKLLDRPGQYGSNTSLAFYGISQGGILGGGYLGLSKDLHRGVLGVPGSPYALILGRSHDFTLYRTLLEFNLYTWRHVRIGITMMGQLWDVGESAGWLNSVTRRPNAGNFKKQILIQAAIGDAQVNTLGAELMARAYGAYSLFNQTRPIWGVPEAMGSAMPVNSSAIVEWKYTDTKDEPIESIPPDGSTDNHECPRRELAGQLQIRDFIERGEFVQHCEGQSCIRPTCDR